MRRLWLRIFRLCMLGPVLLLAAVGVETAVGQEDQMDAALAQLVTTYRDQGPWQVQTEIEVVVQSQGQEGRAKVKQITWIGDAHGRAVATFGGYVTRVEPGQITITHQDTEGRFYQRSLSQADQGAQLAAALRDLWLSIPDPHVELLLAQSVSPDMFARMAPGQGAMKLDATDIETNEQGEITKKTIVFTGIGRHLELSIDPKTGLLKESTLRMSAGPQVAADSVLIYRQRHQVEAVDSTVLDDALQFSPERRQRTDLVASLGPGAKMNVNGGVAVAAGDTAPALELPMLTGPLVNLADLRGEIVIVDFWATWCGPCRRALPHLQEVAEWARQEDKPLVVLAVNTMERHRGVQRRDAIDAVWDQLGLDLTVLLDEGSQTAQAWGVSGIPSTFVIDRAGKIIAHHSGFSPDIGEKLIQEVEQSLAADG